MPATTTTNYSNYQFTDSSAKNGNYDDDIEGVHGKLNVVAVHQSSSVAPFAIMNDNATDRPHEQPRRFSLCDAIWSATFLIQLLVVIVSSMIFIPWMLRLQKEQQRRETSDDDTYHNYQFHNWNIIINPTAAAYTGVCCIMSIFVISLVTKIMMHHSDRLVKFALLLNLTIFTLYNLIFMLSVLYYISNGYSVTINLLYFTPWLATWVYIFILAVGVRRQIPIVTTGIIAAMTLVRDNIGSLSFYAYTSFMLTCSYIVVLYYLLMAIFTIREENYCGAPNSSCTERFWFNGFEYFLILANLYWTSKVLTNIVHVAVADKVGKICVSPAEVDSYSLNSLLRNTATSFGSICMGSLVVDITWIAHTVVVCFRYCSCGLFADCTDPLLLYMKSINRWAYVSMGLHGYRFMEGGTHSMSVFRSRGYTTVVPDLADKLLFMVAMTVGFSCAWFFAFLASLNWEATAYSDYLSHYHTAYSLSDFVDSWVFLPFFLGMFISMTFFSMIGAAVKTVTLCFLESPVEFQKNHPHVYDLMDDAWRREYPGQMEQF